MNKKEFGKKIKSIRIRNKMFQQEMAYSLGYSSRSTINKIEEGINKISHDKINVFCVFAFNIKEKHFLCKNMKLLHL